MRIHCVVILLSRLRRQVAKARHRYYFSGRGGGDRVVHNCKAKWHSFVYFKKYSSYPLQTWNSYSVSQKECIEARMVTQWPVFVELSALVDLDKIAIRRDIYSANSFTAWWKYFPSMCKYSYIFLYSSTIYSLIDVEAIGIFISFLLSEWIQLMNYVKKSFISSHIMKF